MQNNNQKLSYLSGPILFDIDKTLFDTNHFIQLIRKNLSTKVKIEFKTLIKFEDMYIKSLSFDSSFDPSLYCEYIGDKLDIPSFILLQEFTHKKYIYNQSLFSDVLPILKLLKNKDIKVGIFSEGNMVFQKMKIDYSEINSFINTEHIYLFEKKLDQIALKSIPKNAIIIDDKKQVVVELQKNGWRVIWLNRQSNEKHSIVPTISSLTEISLL